MAIPLFRSVRALCLFGAALALTQASMAADPIVTTDLLDLRTVTSIELARDGSRVLFTLQSIAEKSTGEDEAGENGGRSYEYRSHLYLADLSDRNQPPRQLTFGARRDGSATLSPDGRHIAFVRSGDDDTPQVWVLPIDGGEARQVTTMEHGAFGPVWSPDGEQLLVMSDLPIDEIAGSPPYPMERPQRTWNDAELDEDSALEARPDGTRAEIRAWLADNANELDPSVINRASFQGEFALLGLPDVRHLFLIDPDASNDEPFQITDGFFDHDNPVFTPDGKSILYQSINPTDTHPDRERQAKLRKINIDGGGDELFLAIDGWSLGAPQVNRDGTLVAFTSQMQDEPSFRQRRLGVAELNGAANNDAIVMTPAETFETSVWQFKWTDDDSLLFTTSRHGGTPLMKVNFGLLEPTTLVEYHDNQRVGVQVFDTAGGLTVYAQTTPANPNVLMVRDGSGDRMLFDPNSHLATKQLSMPVENWITRPDGARIQYWFMEPTNRDPNASYPLVLNIHGGPSAMWGPGERSMWHEFQLLCSWGYAVVYCNQRGSGGYGYDFQHANFQNWGEGPAGDVLATVDEVLRLHEWIDDDRMVVTGGSYAGYLTAWIVTQDHRFKAAVAQRGVYDLATFFGEGNAWRLVGYAMGGYPFDSRYKQIIDHNSPFTYVNRIRTPLMIMHASNDLRTGVSSSEMLYRALKALDRPVEYIRYPSAGHDLSRTGDPTQRMDRLSRIIEFFERYIDNQRAAPTIDGAD